MNRYVGIKLELIIVLSVHNEILSAFPRIFCSLGTSIMSESLSTMYTLSIERRESVKS